jgi:hypothetical protein
MNEIIQFNTCQFHLSHRPILDFHLLIMSLDFEGIQPFIKKKSENKFYNKMYLNMNLIEKEYKEDDLDSD